MSDHSIVVIGSSNTDMVIKTSRLPLPGETILGGDFLMNPGGKGANQAVAAARLNGTVTFVAKTGKDVFGREARELFQAENMNVEFLFSDDEAPSGIALITVNEQGENCIVVAPGANARLVRADIDKAAKAVREAEIVLMQLEIPLDTVIYATEIAAAAGRKVILNPAPAQPLPAELLSKIYLITPNETEAELLTGIPVKDESSAVAAARALLSKGVKVVVMTLGSQGALLVTDERCELVPTASVRVVDTTAAGDCFNGALAVALCEGSSLPEAISFANKAASISVTRMGAQASAPYRREIG